MTDYLFWEVIFNGDSPAPTRVVKGVVQPVGHTFVEQKLARRNELKCTVDIVPTGNEDNKDVAPKFERRRIDDIIDFIRDKYGCSNESAKLIKDDKEDEVEDDKDQEEEEDDNDEKEQDDNNGSDDETWIPKKEATSNNKDVAPKFERRRIDDIIDFIRDKYGWSEEMSLDESAKLVEDDKEDEVEDDKDQEEEEEEEDKNDEKEQDDNNGSDDETWIPNKEATSSSKRSKKKKVVKRGKPVRHCIIGLCSPKTYDMIGKKDFRVRKEDDKKYVNENKAHVDLTITRKVVSLSLGNFSIIDVNGIVMFKVKAKEISLHGRCSLLNAADNPILSFQKKRSLDVFLGYNGKDVCDYKVKGSWCAQSRTIYAEESTTVVSQNHISHPHCEALKRAAEQGQLSMFRDGSIFVYNPDVLHEQFTGLVIQRGLPFNHFDDKQTTSGGGGSLSKVSHGNQVTSLLRWLKQHKNKKTRNDPSLSSEYERYIHLDFVTHLQTKEFETFDDLGFWKAKETMFLVLSHIAMDILKCKQDKSTFETPVDFEEEILDAEVQANEAIPLSDEEIALDAASSEGSMWGPDSGGEEAVAE
nr:hypothetical protein [Tanacetum cinerariifolium]